MTNRNRKQSGMSHLGAAMLGAIIGGLLVYILSTAISVKKSDDSTELVAMNQKIDQLETQLGNQKNKELDIKEDESLESAVVKKSIDSVVGITTSEEVVRQTFLGPMTGYAEGFGSGSILTEDGYIMTNSHVVNDGDAKEINVLFTDGTQEPAELVWNDATLDLAILKVNRKNLPVMEMGDSDKTGVGDRVVAIGNPLGKEFMSTVTSGIVSGLNRTVNFETGAQLDGLMQTDAAINAGNSGGALLNARGQQIGINTAKAGNADGIGFAIPINLVKPIIDQIVETGEFNSVYLGITGQSLEFFRQYPQINLGELEDLDGVYVQGVFDRSDVFEVGDVITAIDGKKVTDMISLKKILLTYRVGDSAKIEVYRNGKKEILDFTFSINSGNVEQYKKASPENQRDRRRDDRGDSSPFPSLP